MSNAMLAAIRSKKSGPTNDIGDHGGMSHASAHSDDKSKDLHSFVDSLQPHEKDALKTILANDHGKTEQNIAKGGPSTQERSSIDQAIQAENQETAMQEQQEGEHSEQDEIGKSFLDSSTLRGNEFEGKPKNLGDRAKRHIATQLKAKGKL